MTRTVYLNGEHVPVAQARVSVYNGGWLHGAGLFETVRIENRRVFRLGAHLDRLCASAEKLLAPVPRDRLPDPEVWRELCIANGLTEARGRLTVTAGDMLDEHNGQERPLTVCATVSAMTPHPADLYARGVTVMISRYRQSGADPLCGHKSTNYLARLLALKEAHGAGCFEALWFTPQNLLAEGSISNVFIIKGGAVLTPPRDTPVLPGTARALVLELCGAMGVAAREQPITIDELLDADEVFLTNAIMGIMPVCGVERRTIGRGEPGPTTRALRARHREQVAGECGGHE